MNGGTPACLVRYTDIDVQSWVWGDAREYEFIGDARELAGGERPMPDAFLVARPYGNPKHHGFHGALAICDVVVACGVVPEDSTIACILDDGDDAWLEIALALARSDSTPIYTGHDAEIPGPLLAEGELGIIPGSAPPRPSLRLGRLEGKPARRYANATYWKIATSFYNGFGKALPVTAPMMKIATYPAVSGWWDDFDPIDGFGAWHMAKAEIECPGFPPVPDSVPEETAWAAGAIWKRAFDSAGIDPADDDVRDESKMTAWRDELGVASMLEALAHGVPVEDIIA